MFICTTCLIALIQQLPDLLSHQSINCGTRLCFVVIKLSLKTTRFIYTPHLNKVVKSLPVNVYSSSKMKHLTSLFGFCRINRTSRSSIFRITLICIATAVHALYGIHDNILADSYWQIFAHFQCLQTTYLSLH